MDRTTTGILLLIATLIAHLVEEVVSGSWKKLPVGQVPRWLSVGLNAIIYAFCFATLALSERQHALAIPFAWVFALAMVLDGLSHIGPGGITAFVLLPLAALLIASLVNK